MGHVRERSGMPWRLLVGGLLLGIALAVSGPPPRAQALSTASCDFDRGKGILWITLRMGWQPKDKNPPIATGVVRREGDLIRVRGHANWKGKPGKRRMHCGGPTVTNTDRVVVTHAGLTGLVLDTRGGVLAPGRTAEAGQSEIEVLSRTRGRGSSTVVIVAGTEGPDDLRAGSLPGTRMAADLNPADPAPDPDVLVKKGKFETLYLSGAGGDDHLSAAGGPGFIGPAVGKTKSYERYDFDVMLIGGEGADTLTGGARFGFEGFPESNLDGGPGPDVIRGGAGFDNIVGGDGDDAIDSADGGLDQVTCGDGTDTLNGDDRDTEHADPFFEPDCELFGP